MESVEQLECTFLRDDAAARNQRWARIYLRFGKRGLPTADADRENHASHGLVGTVVYCNGIRGVRVQ